jgi:hypothetical protein
VGNLLIPSLCALANVPSEVIEMRRIQVRRSLRKKASREHWARTGTVHPFDPRDSDVVRAKGLIGPAGSYIQARQTRVRNEAT